MERELTVCRITEEWRCQNFQFMEATKEYEEECSDTRQELEIKGGKWSSKCKKYVKKS